MAAYSSAHTPKLSDRFKGKWFGRQLAETVDEFLRRLRPATTEGSEELQWIWISNPYLSLPPSDEGSENISIMCSQGASMLNELENITFRLQQKPPHQPAAMTSRDISIARDKTVTSILNLAVQMKITSGKWMLFPLVHEVDHVWSIIAHAVAANQLGTGAKVSPKREDPETRSRLICIYTHDFSDTEDVIRVLQKLKELGLVPCGSTIYYKCDAYTHLNIFSRNIWGITESLYDSTEIQNWATHTVV
ncbi:hypothetical protein V490_05616 [Pseudogymnoascus sp. VKM F-3557]|nr:hypothetical protein V490_05616 [Pseudogymnoascus sp. VKM F-3557]